MKESVGLSGGSLRKVIEADGDTDVTWKADVDAQVDEALLCRTCMQNRCEKGAHAACGDRTAD